MSASKSPGPAPAVGRRSAPTAGTWSFIPPRRAFILKLAIALAFLIGGLSLASHSVAGAVATLRQPVAKPVQFVANRALWTCKDHTCIAGSVDDMYFGPGECHTVAKHAGVAVSE